jgi:hypothetical protein
MPRRPRAPAMPAPTIWVGMDAPPVEDLDEAVVVAEATTEEAAAPNEEEAAAVAEVVLFKNLPVAEELLLYKPVPVNEAVVGIAEPAAVRK